MWLSTVSCCPALSSAKSLFFYIFLIAVPLGYFAGKSVGKILFPKLSLIKTVVEIDISAEPYHCTVIYRPIDDRPIDIQSA